MRHETMTPVQLIQASLNDAQKACFEQRQTQQRAGYYGQGTGPNLSATLKSPDKIAQVIIENSRRVDQLIGQLPAIAAIFASAEADPFSKNEVAKIKRSLQVLLAGSYAMSAFFKVNRIDRDVVETLKQFDEITGAEQVRQSEASASVSALNLERIRVQIRAVETEISQLRATGRYARDAEMRLTELKASEQNLVQAAEKPVYKSDYVRYFSQLEAINHNELLHAALLGYTLLQGLGKTAPMINELRQQLFQDQQNNVYIRQVIDNESQCFQIQYNAFAHEYELIPAYQTELSSLSQIGSGLFQRYGYMDVINLVGLLRVHGSQSNAHSVFLPQERLYTLGGGVICVLPQQVHLSQLNQYLRAAPNRGHTQVAQIPSNRAHLREPQTLNDEEYRAYKRAASRPTFMSELLLFGQRLENLDSQSQKLFSMMDALIKAAGPLNLGRLLQLESNPNELLDAFERFSFHTGSIDGFAENVENPEARRVKQFALRDAVLYLHMVNLICAAPIEVNGQLKCLTLPLEEQHWILSVWREALLTGLPQDGYDKVTTFLSYYFSMATDAEAMKKNLDELSSTRSVIGEFVTAQELQAVDNQIALLTARLQPAERWGRFVAEHGKTFAECPIIDITLTDPQLIGEKALSTAMSRLCMSSRLYLLPTIILSDDQESNKRVAPGIAGLIDAFTRVFAVDAQAAVALVKGLAGPGMAEDYCPQGLDRLNTPTVNFSFLPRLLLMMIRFSEHSALLEPKSISEYSNALYPVLLALGRSYKRLTEQLEQNSFKSGTVNIDLAVMSQLLMVDTRPNGNGREKSAAEALASNPLAQWYCNLNEKGKIRFLDQLFLLQEAGLIEALKGEVENWKAQEINIIPVKFDHFISQHQESILTSLDRSVLLHHASLQNPRTQPDVVEEYDNNALLDDDAGGIEAVMQVADTARHMENIPAFPRWFRQRFSPAVQTIFSFYDRANSYEKVEFDRIERSVFLLYVVEQTHGIADAATRSSLILSLYGKRAPFTNPSKQEAEEKQVLAFIEKLITGYQKLSPEARINMPAVLALHDAGKCQKFRETHSAYLQATVATVANHQSVLMTVLQQDPGLQSYLRFFQNNDVLTLLDLFDVGGHSLENMKSFLLNLVQAGKKIVSDYEACIQTGQTTQHAEWSALRRYLSGFVASLQSQLLTDVDLTRFAFLTENLSLSGLSQQQQCNLAELMTFGLCRLLSTNPKDQHVRFSDLGDKTGAKGLYHHIAEYFANNVQSTGLRSWIKFLMDNVTGQRVRALYNVTGLLWHPEFGLFSKKGINAESLFEVVIPHLLSKLESAEMAEAPAPDMSINVFQLIQMVEYWQGLIAALSENDKDIMNKGSAKIRHIDCGLAEVAESCLQAIQQAASRSSTAVAVSSGLGVLASASARVAVGLAPQAIGGDYNSDSDADAENANVNEEAEINNLAAALFQGPN